MKKGKIIFLNGVTSSGKTSIVEDRNCPWRTDEWLAVALRSLEHFSKSDDCIKTDGLSIEEVADAVYNMSHRDGSVVVGAVI